MAFDWEEMRAMMIQAHGIRRADENFAFYYDECERWSGSATM